MKWLFTALVQLIGSVCTGIITILSSIATQGLWLSTASHKPANALVGTTDISNLTNIMFEPNTTLNTFFTVFHNANKTYTVLCAVGIVMMMGLYFYSIFKSLFGPLTEAENLIRLTGRYFIYTVGIAIIKPMMNFILNLATIPFLVVDNNLGNIGDAAKDGVSQIFSPDALAGGSYTTSIGNLPFRVIENALFGLADVLSFLLVLLLLMILVEYVKYFIELVLRYVLLGVLILFAPVAFALGPFSGSAQIFQGWKKALFSQLVLIIMSNFFLKVFVNSWIAFNVYSWFADIPLIVAYMMFFAWLKIGQKVDTYMSNMGAGALQTGNGLWADLYAAGMFLAKPATKALGAGALGARGLTFASNLLGKPTPDGKNIFTNPFNIGARFKNNMQAGAMENRGFNSNNPLKNFIKDPIKSTTSKLGAMQYSNGLMNFSAQNLRNMASGVYSKGMTSTKGSVGLGKSVESMFNNPNASNSLMRAKNITSARINADNGQIFGSYMDGDTPRNFEMFVGNQKELEGMLGDRYKEFLDDKNLSDFVTSFKDENGNDWTLVPFADLDQNGDLVWATSLKDAHKKAPEFSSSEFNFNNMFSSSPSGSIEKDIHKGMAAATAMSALSSKVGLGPSLSSAVDLKNPISSSKISTGANIGLSGRTVVGNGGVEQKVLSSEDHLGGVRTPSYSSDLNSSVTASGNTGFVPSSMLESMVSDSSVIDVNEGVGSDVYTDFTGDSIPNSLISSTSENAVISQLPNTGNYAIIEGYTQNSDGSYKKVGNLSSASYMSVATGDSSVSSDIMPMGQRYELSKGHVALSSSLTGDKAIVGTNNDGVTYSDSYSQVYANDILSSGCMFNSLSDGIIEVDTDKTLNSDGSFTAGNPIYSTNGKIYYENDIQGNEYGGFAVFRNSNEGNHFVATNGGLYEAVSMDNNEIQMMTLDSDSNLKYVNNINQTDGIAQINAKNSKGEIVQVTPRNFTKDGYVQKICYPKGQAVDQVAVEYELQKKLNYKKK